MITLTVTAKDRDANLGIQPYFLLPCLSSTYHNLIIIINNIQKLAIKLNLAAAAVARLHHNNALFLL